MREGILSVIGNTPLVKLSRVFPDADFDIYAKLEGLNPGGSTKDRPAFNIINHGIARRLVATPVPMSNFRRSEELT